MNRIEQKFKSLKAKNKKAFIAFVTAGDPGLRKTEEIILALEKAGVDIVEMGIPFSDPMADGPTIQASFLRALQKGVKVQNILDTVKRLRRKTELPIAFMMSYNLIFHYGQEQFIKACRAAGVDGLIVPDLPPEEAVDLRALAKRHDISMIFFVAPTTVEARIKANTKASTGFIYYLSLTGITGTQKAVSSSVVKHIQHIKRFTDKPVCAGFGISTPQQVKEISKAADGVIVGSAIVKVINQNKGNLPAVIKYVSFLVDALR
ncbi:MAG: tryptophan synthase subunit alpha [Candidatus Omnitrophica bacterium]|nr:tryptophan synthase subunit alpha [Candidatus Omnitrophota bacterium]